MNYLHSESFPDNSVVGEPGEQKPGFRRAFKEFFETLLLAAILFVVINAATARILVQSISMQPNLFEGDLVLVNRFIYWFSIPSRGDVIVFQNPHDPDGVPYIKRVIGLPGDHIQIQDGQVLVNDLHLYEPYLQSETQNGGEWQVSQDAVFVMGDNRNNSSDSRAWGFVPVGDLIGRAEAVYWPPRDWQVLHQDSAQAAQP